MKQNWWRSALTLAACALAAACVGVAPRIANYAPIRSIERDYHGPALGPELPSCQALLASPLPRRRDGEVPVAERITNWSTREVHARVLSFDEVYASGRVHAALLDPVDFATEITEENDRERHYLFVRVPAGFVTDFSSIPSGLAQSLHRTFGRTAVPAIAHDFLYAVGTPGDSEGRRIADRALRRGMRDNGSGGVSRRIVFLAVQFGGADSYGQDRELRFFDPSRGADAHRIVQPIADREMLYRRYVRICPPLPASASQSP